MDPMPVMGDSTPLSPFCGLGGKRILVTGVLTSRSIAYSVALRAQQAGAEIVLTSFGRADRLTKRTARKLPTLPDILTLDVNEPADLNALRDELEKRWGGVDGALHAIASAPPDAINGNFLTTTKESAVTTFLTSAYSLHGLTIALRPLLQRAQGSVVGLHLDAGRAWPQYDWMGVSKAALASVTKYLARYLGPEGVRVNLVAPGLLRTAASSAFVGFPEYAEQWAGLAPLGWDIDDASPVADAVLFLFSECSRAITGEIIHVDGGRHAIEA